MRRSLNENCYDLRKHAIYVVDLEGYIGASVRKEMEYAERNGKEIILHSDLPL